MLASERGFCEIANLLLDMGAQVDLQNSNGISALMCSSNKELAMEGGAHVDLRDNAGMSALMFASKQGLFGVAKLLLDKGAQVNLRDNAGRSVLVWACRNLSEEIEDFGEVYSQYQYNKHYEVAKLLLESGAKLDRSLIQLYMSACKRGDCGVVELLLDAGVEVDAKVKYGMGSTGLMHASKGGHCELVELLLSRGSRVNQQQEYDKSSLMYASEGGHAEVVKLLLKAGARADLQADNGFTAKLLAKRRRHMDVVKLLEDPTEVSSMLSIQIYVVLVGSPTSWPKRCVAVAGLPIVDPPMKDTLNNKGHNSDTFQGSKCPPSYCANYFLESLMTNICEDLHKFLECIIFVRLHVITCLRSCTRHAQ